MVLQNYGRQNVVENRFRFYEIGVARWGWVTLFVQGSEWQNHDRVRRVLAHLTQAPDLVVTNTLIQRWLENNY